jgi:hypothetical protein
MVLPHVDAPCYYHIAVLAYTLSLVIMRMIIILFVCQNINIMEKNNL